MLVILFGISVAIFLVSLFFRLKGTRKPSAPAKNPGVEVKPAPVAEPMPAVVVRPRPPLVLYQVPFVVKLVIFLLLSAIGYLLYYYGVPTLF